MFFNRDVDGPVKTMSLDSVSDGAQETLLLAENIQAGRWTDTSEADLGMVWRETPEPCSRVNECLDAGDRPQDIAYARPSSHHAGGVVVSFCDGHQVFVSEQVDYQVYQHLMTPDSAKAGLPGKLEEDWCRR